MRRISDGGMKKMFSQIAVLTSSTIAAATRISCSVYRSGKPAFTSRINECATSRIDGASGEDNPDASTSCIRPTI